MSTLIPSISIIEFRKLKIQELKQLKSCEITSDGEYLFTFVNPQTDYIRIRGEYLALLSNTVGGIELDALLSEEKTRLEFPNLVKARAVRQANLAKKKVLV